MSQIALALWQRGDYGEAESRYAELIAVINAMDQPEVAAAIATRINLAAVRADALKLDEAERDFRQILDESRRINGATHINTVTAEARLGALLHATSRREEGRALLADALAKTGEGTANDLPHMITLVRRSYGTSMLAEGRMEDAERALAQDLALSRASYPGSVRLADALRAHGAVTIALGHFDQAERELDEGYTLRRGALGKSAPPAALNAFRLEQARLALARGDPERAAASLDAVAKLSGTLPLAVEETGARILRAHIWLQRGRPAEAAAAARQALDDIVRSPLRGKFQALEADAALRLGQAQLRAGDALAARPSLARAVELREATDDPDLSPWLAEAQIALATCLLDLGQRPAARALLSQAAAIHGLHAQLGEQFREPLRRVQDLLAAR